MPFPLELKVSTDQQSGVAFEFSEGCSEAFAGGSGETGANLTDPGGSVNIGASPRSTTFLTSIPVGYRGIQAWGLGKLMEYISAPRIEPLRAPDASAIPPGEGLRVGGRARPTQESPSRLA